MKSLLGALIVVGLLTGCESGSVYRYPFETGFVDEQCKNFNGAGWWKATHFEKYTSYVIKCNNGFTISAIQDR